MFRLSNVSTHNTLKNNKNAKGLELNCLIDICFSGAFGQTELNATVVVMKGHSVRMLCKNDKSNEALHWYYYSLSNQKPTIVFNGEGVLSTRFEIDMKRPGHCDLMINNTTVNDAGTYECLRHIPSPDRPDRSKPYVVRSIKLTVLGKICIAHFLAYFNSPFCF